MHIFGLGSKDGPCLSLDFSVTVRAMIFICLLRPVLQAVSMEDMRVETV